jgi:hypothetical protein
VEKQRPIPRGVSIVVRAGIQSSGVTICKNVAVVGEVPITFKEVIHSKAVIIPTRVRIIPFLMDPDLVPGMAKVFADADHDVAVYA